jgi:aldose 1-epimerase
VIIDRLPFGTLPDGRAVHLFRLHQSDSFAVEVLDYGGIVRALRVPDRAGTLTDVVLGYDDLDGYVTDPWFFGGIIGRYAGRIREGRFELDGWSVRLATNNGPHHLHGAGHGFHKRLWRAEPFASAGNVGIDLRLTDDASGGYPGLLEVHVAYTLTAAHEWIVDYEATAGEVTVLNLTQHTYFNLAGRGDVLGHRLAVNADTFAEVDDTLVPTGALRPVAGTPLDFRNGVAIGTRIDDEALRASQGYDHDFVVRRDADGLAPAARVLEPRSGRTLQVATTEPALHVYSGNFMDGSRFGKGGRRFGPRQGLCLETQHLPDSPNHPEFPSTVLRPGEEFRSRTVYGFGVDR